MFSGIFPPLPTPFKDDEIDFAKLENNISKFNKTGLAGYVTLGSNGEAAFLTREEKIELVKKTKSAASIEKKIIAGTGTDSIKETLILTEEAAKAGADAALILTPSYYTSQMSNKALIQYFTSVAAKSPLPIFIYNVPKFTGIDIPPSVVGELSSLDKIIGIKDSTENIIHIMEILNSTPKDFDVFTGTGSMFYSSFSVGAKGGIAALANVVPELCVKVQTLFNSGGFSEALELQNKLIELNKAVTARFGVAGLKYAMDIMGYEGGEVRNPLQPIGINEKQEIEKILNKVRILTV